MSEQTISTAIESQGYLDRAANPIQGAVRRALDKAPALHDALHGTWLGHPLHAAVTDLPIGAWWTGMALDVIELSGGRRRYRYASDAALAIGLGGAMLAALAGLTDWTHTRGGAKRVGFLHGALNGVIAGLYGGSLFARSRGRRDLGIALSTTGFAMMLFSSWLGGQLSYYYGVGVRPAAEAGESQQREAFPPPAVREAA